DVVQKDIPVVDPDTLVADIMALAAEAPYPIAAVGKDGQLKGIVTKAKVLSSLV
ncbi:MAG TPA: glycine betaine/L-proline ABC transporter ATP-binding protein, partial [Lachnospiraceae bacterium]|nr:glycine betaine/L-proline ABC transporter ATP-binding protein [Lachnospiraceae bacterium]